VLRNLSHHDAANSGGSLIACRVQISVGRLSGPNPVSPERRNDAAPFIDPATTRIHVVQTYRHSQDTPSEWSQRQFDTRLDMSMNRVGQVKPQGSNIDQHIKLSVPPNLTERDVYVIT
jgi:hypothetical protein